jgi:hypothetical protein
MKTHGLSAFIGVHRRPTVFFTVSIVAKSCNHKPGEASKKK